LHSAIKDQPEEVSSDKRNLIRIAIGVAVNASPIVGLDLHAY
jgi:hypothetical protein